MPDVEGGILPPGLNVEFCVMFKISKLLVRVDANSVGLETRLYGRQGCLSLRRAQRASSLATRHPSL